MIVCVTLACYAKSIEIMSNVGDIRCSVGGIPILAWMCYNNANGKRSEL